MEQIKTAEEFLREKIINSKTNNFRPDWEEVSEWVKEFAKYHVKLALESAVKKAQLSDFAYEFLQEGAEDAIDKDSILNSYNLDNIK